MCKKNIAILLLVMLILSGCNSNDEKVLPSPSTYTVVITLNYQKVILTSNTPMNVYVDDMKLGKQEAGTEQKYSISLEEGEHKFYLKNDGIYKTDEIIFEVTSNNNSFIFGAKTRLTFGVELWDNTNYASSNDNNEFMEYYQETSPDNDLESYLYPSNSQYITEDELSQLTQEEIRLIRNEIYARHGCNFKDSSLREYFDSQSWYDPIDGLYASDFDESLFNNYEKTNIRIISNYEQRTQLETEQSTLGLLDYEVDDVVQLYEGLGYDINYEKIEYL